MVTKIIRALKPLNDNLLNSLDKAKGIAFVIPQYCTSAGGPVAVAGMHKFTDVHEHNQYIDQYQTRTGNRISVNATWTDIEEIIGPVDAPLNDYLYFELFGGILTYKGGVGKAPDHFIDYSSCHLHGIRQKHNNNMFTFSMAFDHRCNEDTVAISTENGGYYDFSNLHP